ncbi:carboxymuconolactone decarboxylase family protein [Brevibacterium sp. BRM-1]|uniref:carboxymuconolactone decarboxylase family protein n=1 Tax=Brevibacterium sp. BRM-1 TaxID=2999062 RepID=UPI002282A004|nr:carboxymuconolactone decarboxylase family protein [Brevibacterium sp. BRM-1]WAL39502.1 carboxymuconolactone decarboxylase family protein [Brevibacterium sp. BRM-1]
MKRPYIDKAAPQVQKAMEKAAVAAREASHAAGLEDSTIELVNVRVSQLNGCPTCLSIHVPQARAAGVSQRQLDLLPSWPEARGVYTDVERAALLLAESLTVIDQSADRNALVERAAQALTADQIAAVEWTAVLINAFNRISIASGHPPRPE